MRNEIDAMLSSLDIADGDIATVYLVQGTNALVINSLIEFTAKHFNIPANLIKGNRRTAEAADARKIVYYLLCAQTTIKPTEVGSSVTLKRQTESNVRYAWRFVRNQIPINSTVARDVKLIESAWLEHLEKKGIKLG